MNSQDLIILFSLSSMGFFGGFGHCMAMCGPFVITQLSSNLSHVKIDDYKGLNKISKIALIPYHLGRITTYSILGFITAFLRSSLDKNIGFEIFSGLLLLVACMFFVNLLFRENKSFLSKFLGKKINFIKSKTPKKIHKITQKTLSFLFSRLTKKINFLLNNSMGIKGYYLGLILGFIPCGMLYGAFALAGSLSSPFLAIIGMLFFGLTTFVALFCVGFFARITAKLPEFKIIANIVIIFNIAMLFKIILKKIF